MTPPLLNAASVQFQHRASDKAFNLQRIQEFSRRAAARNTQIVAFPEMCITGYWHVPKLDWAEIDALAEPLDGPSIGIVAKLAAQ